MFKKSLIALALAGASTAAFAAADITGTTATEYSKQGKASATELAAPNVVVELGAEYSVGDIITFTFAGSELDTTTAPSTVTAPGVVVDSMTLGLLSSTTSSITYRVTELDTATNGTTITETLTLTGLEFDTAAGLASGKVTVTFAAQTSTGIAIDEGSTSTANVIVVSDQYALDRSSDDDFDAVVDVEENRLEFDGGALSDVAEITVTNDTTLTDVATAGSSELVVTGSFTFLDTDADTDGIQLAADSVYASIDGGTTKLAPDSITDTMAKWDAITTTAASTTIQVGLVAPGDVVIPEQDFSADLEVNYTDADAEDGSVELANGTDIGSWTLNGSVVNVPYLPFGPVTEPVLRHTNKGMQTGDITMRFMVEGVHSAWTDSVVLVENAGPGVRNLRNLVTDALKDAGYDSSVSGFKVALEITTNVKSGDVTVFAAAKVTTSDSDRLSVGSFSN